MFVLAHLSDPHLAPLPRARPGELANKRLLGFLNWYRCRRKEHRREVLDSLVADLARENADHIAVTGDLVNISLDAEFAGAAAWLASLGAVEDVTVIPGNHDAYVPAAKEQASRYWLTFMRGDGSNEVAFPFVRRRGPAALIGLSTAIPTLPFMATGALGSGQLQRLAQLLPELEHEGLFRIVLIHHPPFRTPGKGHKRLLDAKAFRDVLAVHGAELVLHGHDHVPSLIWLKGPRAGIPVFGVPSASSPRDCGKAPATYNLYRIEGAPGEWQCEAIARGFQPGREGIVELARRTIAGEAPAARR